MKIFASRILTALLAVLLLLTAAACTPADGGLETNPVIGDGTASPELLGQLVPALQGGAARFRGGLQEV